MNIFVDGEYGTTGLHLVGHLKAINDVNLLRIPVHDKKDPHKRKELLNQADVVFLCLPDEAAVASANMVENPETVIIDCSTAHRTTWTYGFSELDDEFHKEITTSNRIANPGCHATGFCAIVYPLVKKSIISQEQTVYSYALTGYSGGGREKIEEYESDDLCRGASIYSLDMKHKHLAEMQKVCRLNKPPMFSPIIVDIPRGMLVSVAIEGPAEEIYTVLNKHYENTRIDVLLSRGQLNMEDLNNTNDLTIHVCGNEDQTLAVSQLDNLGKGAGGAAVQNFKIRMGLV